MANTTRQTAAITGAGDGIGRALAVNLNERGIDLYLCDIDQERLDATVAMLDTARSSVSTALVDCGNRAEIESWAATITSENDRLDFLFNNAGVAYGAAFRDASLDNFEWLMNINYWGVVWCTKALLPLLEASPSGHLVNISSIFGMVGIATQSAYNSAKFAVRGFTESLQAEYLLPARFNDLLIIDTQVHKSRRASLIFSQKIRDLEQNKVLFEAQVTVACLDVKNFKPCAIPSDILEKING